jgi:hypothetical protein
LALNNYRHIYGVSLHASCVEALAGLATGYDLSKERGNPEKDKYGIGYGRRQSIEEASDKSRLRFSQRQVPNDHSQSAFEPAEAPYEERDFSYSDLHTNPDVSDSDP